VNWAQIVVSYILGLLSKIFYDWKIQPAITRSHRKREQREIEEQEKERRAQRERINNLNYVWKRDRKILSEVQQILEEFNRMNKFPDRYNASKCLELASNMENELKKIEWSEFKDIKQKTLEYAERKSQIDQNTPLNVLMKIFQKRIEPNKYEPLALSEKIEEILRLTATQPYSEEDF